VAPGGRAVLYEALIPSTTVRRARDGLARALRRAAGVARDHHAPYDPEVLAALPLARSRNVEGILRCVARAGWRRYRVERLREVERARLRAGPPVIARLEAVRRFAVLAE
jgi:hypothetical protein